MSENPLTEAQRESALRNIRGPDLEAIVQAAKLLSADHSTTARLLELLASEGRVEVRHALLYALSWHADVSLRGLMIQILADQREHPKVRGQAAEGISYLFYKVRTDSKEFEAVVNALQDALRDGSPEVRYCVVNALGATKHLPLIPVLEGMREDQTSVEGWVGTVGEAASRAIKWIEMANSLRRGIKP
jgi:HEAT repeat protein